MAFLQLLPRKEFILTLEDGAIIKGQFGTYALNKFTTDRKIKLSDIGGIFGNQNDVQAIIDYVVCACYQSYRQDKIKEPFAIEDVDIYKWFDQVGGFASQPAIDLITHASDSQEKKSETQPQESL